MEGHIDSRTTFAYSLTTGEVDTHDCCPLLNSTIVHHSLDLYNCACNGLMYRELFVSVVDGQAKRRRDIAAFLDRMADPSRLQLISDLLLHFAAGCPSRSCVLFDGCLIRNTATSRL